MVFKKRFAFWLLAPTLILVLLSLSGCWLLAPQPGTPAAETLTIGLTPWSSTIPPTYIVQAILEEELGYDVTLQEADVGVVYSGLATGDIDLFLDAWLPNMHESYMAEYGDRIEELGVSYTEGLLGWAVPTYVTVDSIDQLNDYRDEFGGQVIGIDPGAGMMQTSADIIAGYDLDFELVEGSEWAMLAELRRAIDQEDWIVFLAWRPHWIFASYDLKFLEDPEGFWEQDEVRTLATEGLRERAPEAVAFLENWQIPIEDLEELIFRMEVEEEPIEELTREWLEENQDMVAEMLP